MNYPRVVRFQRTENLSSLEKRSHFNGALKDGVTFQLSGIFIGIRGHFYHPATIAWERKQGIFKIGSVTPFRKSNCAGT